ncbi:hypothetical protein HELRODRAFT_170792 [Helobdella robusta]|uniref:Uncharacterized protein n=1 Tax=Helobdella robusta TaxID=6412 RepID=T1F3F5_HELRO|nr:hypothetical protein HELRODRAFT_170792 [Helobdella robusta]ESO06776.1 hypothetical protein HELRODRAFT_170792 [Helobdella robusta]
MGFAKLITLRIAGSNAVQELSKLPNIKTTVWILPDQIMSTDQSTNTKTNQQQQQQHSINNNYDEGDYYEEVQRKVRSHDSSFNDRLKRDAATEAGDRMMENFVAEEDDKTVENVLADEKISIEGKIKNILLEVRNLRIATIVLINFDNLLNVQMILSEALKLSLLTNRQNWIMLNYVGSFYCN